MGGWNSDHDHVTEGGFNPNTFLLDLLPTHQIKSTSISLKLLFDLLGENYLYKFEWKLNVLIFCGFYVQSSQREMIAETLNSFKSPSG